MKTVTVRWNKNSRRADYFGQDIIKCTSIDIGHRCVTLEIGNKQRYIPYTSFAEMEIE